MHSPIDYELAEHTDRHQPADGPVPAATTVPPSSRVKAKPYG